MNTTGFGIDPGLVERAMWLSGARSKKETLELALRELIREHQGDILAREIGTFDIEIDFDDTLQ